jgi:hypothetical protein
MLAGTISLMLREPVARIHTIHLDHHAIPCDLCHYAGSSYAEAARVATDNCSRITGQARYGQAIYQGMVRHGVNIVKGARHREVCGPQNVHAINLFHTRYADTNGYVWGF